MEIFPELLAWMLFVSFLFGIQLGVIFDALASLRIFAVAEPRRGLKKLPFLKLPLSGRPLNFSDNKKSRRIIKNIIILIGDFFISVYGVYGLSVINYSYNDGKFRFFTVVGVAVGFVCYYFTVSRLVRALLELVILAVRYLFTALLELFCRPISFVYNIFVKKFKKISEKFAFRIEKKAKRVYNVNEILCKNEDLPKKRVRIRSATQKNKGEAKNEGE